MTSILQKDKEKCFLCGGFGNYLDPLEEHHVFFGPFRKKSEQYGLKVYIHGIRCHRLGVNSAHANADVCRDLQKHAQAVAMAYYGWSVDDFIGIFGRNYL